MRRRQATSCSLCSNTMQCKLCVAVVFLSALAIEGILAKPGAYSHCSWGKPLVECLVDPCIKSSCPADSTATCTTNNCGGCNAIWLDSNGVRVSCKTKSKCPYGQKEYQCVEDPCEGKKCPGYPEAFCVSNCCGGCNFNWLDSYGKPVKCYASR